MDVNFNDADVHTEEWSIYTEYTASRVARYTGGKYRGFEIVHKKDCSPKVYPWKAWTGWTEGSSPFNWNGVPCSSCNKIVPKELMFLARMIAAGQKMGAL